MAKVPVQMQTINDSGEVTSTETVSFQIVPAPTGTCPECGAAHDANIPHNAQSLHYQYTFYGREGRWPTWKDAMAHCEPRMQDDWMQALIERGVDVEAGQIIPQEGW
jgi:hypothetical protein